MTFPNPNPPKTPAPTPPPGVLRYVWARSTHQSARWYHEIVQRTDGRLAAYTECGRGSSHHGWILAHQAGPDRPLGTRPPEAYCCPTCALDATARRRWLECAHTWMAFGFPTAWNKPSRYHLVRLDDDTDADRFSAVLCDGESGYFNRSAAVPGSATLTPPEDRRCRTCTMLWHVNVRPGGQEIDPAIYDTITGSERRRLRAASREDPPPPRAPAPRLPFTPTPHHQLLDAVFPPSVRAYYRDQRQQGAPDDN